MAHVALARRDLLMRVYRHRLRAEDLEDCYSQATLELVQRARTGTPFSGTHHISNALEQKLISRINDRRRALAGRSPIEAALGQAVALEPPDGGTGQLADPGPGVDEQVAMRADLRALREIASELTPDMRLLLAHQVGLGTECQAFCRRYAWSPEKFRKVAQRARQRLLALSKEYASGERCRRLEPDLLAYVSRVASDDQRDRVQSHLDNCMACRRRARDLRVAERGLLAFVPGGLEAGSAGLAGGAIGSAASGTGVAAAGGGAFAWGGSGLLGVKLGVAAICIASLAGGGLAICRHGPLADVLGTHRPGGRRIVRVDLPPQPTVTPIRRFDIVPAPRAVTLGAAATLSGASTSGPSARVSTPISRPPPAAAAQREFGLGFDALAGSNRMSNSSTPGQTARTATSSALESPSRRRHRSRRRRRATPAILTTRLRSSSSPPTVPIPSAPRPDVTAATGPGPHPGPSSPANGEFGFERG